MRLPRDIDASDLIKAIRYFGYETTRQTGSHIKLTTQQNGQHHLTIPNHDPIKIGTLQAIVTEVAQHAGLSKEEVIVRLY